MNLQSFKQYRFNSNQKNYLHELHECGGWFEPTHQANRFTGYPEICVFRDTHSKRDVVLSKAVAIAIERNKPLPALHRAIQSCDLGKARLLVMMGADVNERGPFGWTPLHVLAQTYTRYELHSAQKLAALDNLAKLMLNSLRMDANGQLVTKARVDLKDCFGLNALASADGKGPPSLRKATSECLAETAFEMKNKRNGYVPHRKS
ncbi:ankyrin repeat domain-containing protein [Pseudoxanthomonas winnipegensis]|uniref:ankyrin repeat domain-containing protein n=1 Tax=Pseudoxanthomonas winnipegensis TaxID=2480810 RepID=UPI00103C0095|nr:ankyrin repeat domain-containing protein [Pseudoxanthomonas winnipegensis]TBV69169.1 hypothetical protein EYC45_19820 [Pseudoxanthomonas winnipegensis]